MRTITKNEDGNYILLDTTRHDEALKSLQRAEENLPPAEGVRVGIFMPMGEWEFECVSHREYGSNVRRWVKVGGIIPDPIEVEVENPQWLVVETHRGTGRPSRWWVEKDYPDDDSYPFNMGNTVVIEVDDGWDEDDFFVTDDRGYVYWK